jgi:hypothetical protein
MTVWTLNIAIMGRVISGLWLDARRTSRPWVGGVLHPKTVNPLSRHVIYITTFDPLVPLQSHNACGGKVVDVQTQSCVHG